MFRKNIDNSSVFGRKVSGPVRRFGAKISVGPTRGSINSNDKPQQSKLEKK